MERNRVSQAVILAGGLGTRLQPYTDHNPKPLFPLNGKPFIEYLLLQIREFGIKEALLLLGYRAEKIQAALGDGGRFGMHITYDVTPTEFNTADRLLHARSCLDERVLLMYCDNYCPIDFGRLCQDFCDHQALVQISAYENKDGYTRDNLRIDHNGQVLAYDKKRMAHDLQGVDIGYAIIDRRALDYIEGEGLNFEAAVYPRVIKDQKMFATVTKHRYYSIGSWERIQLTRRFFDQKPTVFLDRDGTVNVKPPKACYVESPEEFIWLEGAKEAIKLLRDFGYRVLMVTNQPGIARGRLSRDMLQKIHEKMLRDLEEAGASIDRIYCCPHNWEEGCECRKPKPGMLYQAQKDYSLNLTECILIGDDERDMEAGRAAGCRTYRVTEDKSLLAVVRNIVKREEDMKNKEIPKERYGGAI